MFLVPCPSSRTRDTHTFGRWLTNHFKAPTSESTSRSPSPSLLAGCIFSLFWKIKLCFTLPALNGVDGKPKKPHCGLQSQREPRPASLNCNISISTASWALRISSWGLGRHAHREVSSVSSFWVSCFCLFACLYFFQHSLRVLGLSG